MPEGRLAKIIGRVADVVLRPDAEPRTRKGGERRRKKGAAGTPRGGTGTRRAGAGAPAVPAGRSPETDPAKTGGIEISYAPERDGDADPGEVVWTWVPYEDDPSEGKDRPVLILGYEGERLVGVQLSSKDRSGRRDEDEWVPVGTGGWDRQGRPSYADAARLLRIEQSAVRREGSALERSRFDQVMRRVEELHGWHS